MHWKLQCAAKKSAPPKGGGSSALQNDITNQTPSALIGLADLTISTAKRKQLKIIRSITFWPPKFDAKKKPVYKNNNKSFYKL